MISQCVILVGGLGTRLGALTRATPKPLLPVGSRPFLDYLIERAARFGFTEVILLAGYLGDQMLARYAGKHRIAGRDVAVRVVVESEPAGTGGALRYLDGVADEFFVLMNGDSWLDLDLRAFAENLPIPPAAVKIALRRLDSAGRYGSVVLKEGRITDFDAAGSGGSDGFINAGVYLASRSLIGEVRQKVCSLERDTFVRMAGEGKLAGEVSSGFFIDIGTTDDYARSARALLENIRRPAVFFDRDGVLNRDAGYTYRPDDLHWNDGAIAAVKAVNDAGWYAFVVSNQAGIGHGLYSENDVDHFHRHMDAAMAKEGAHIDEYVYCPFHPEAKLEVYRQVSPHRKPAPGMILDLLARWPVDAEKSFLVGDKEIDLQAASAAAIGGSLSGEASVRSNLAVANSMVQELARRAGCD